jgi:hypothetical protein
MRLDGLRPAFLNAAGERPRGWDELWAAFVAVIGKGVQEPEILRDDISVAIVPAHPHDSPLPRASLTRKIGIAGEDPDYDLEAQLAITIFWTSSVDVGTEIITMTARGPSSYEGDPRQPVEELVAQVQRHPVVAVLRGADAQLERWVAEYLPPEELD